MVLSPGRQQWRHLTNPLTTNGAIARSGIATVMRFPQFADIHAYNYVKLIWAGNIG